MSNDEMPLGVVQDLAQKALAQALRTEAALRGITKSIIYIMTGVIKEFDAAGYMSKNKIIAIFNERISSERLAIDAAERLAPTPRWLTENEFQELCDRYKIEQPQRDRLREVWCPTLPATDSRSIEFHSERESHRAELLLLEAVVGTLMHVEPKPPSEAPERGRLKSIDGGKSA